MVSETENREEVCVFYLVEEVSNHARDGILQASMIKALACVNDFDLVRDMMNLLRNDARLKLMALSSLPQNVMIFQALDIDVVLLDCTIHTLEALKLSKSILQHHIEIRIVYMFKEVNQDIIEYIYAHDPQASFLFEPFEVEKVIAQLAKEKACLKQEKRIQLKEEGYATAAMQSLNIPPHLRGYRYIKTAAILLYHAEGGIMTMKQLYKETARIHNTTATRVEKTMRDAIEQAYKNSSNTWMSVKKPTNSQIIHYVYEQMVLRSEKTDKNRRSVDG